MDKYVYLCLKKEWCRMPRKPIQNYSRNILTQKKSCFSTYSTVDHGVGRGVGVYIRMYLVELAQQ